MTTASATPQQMRDRLLQAIDSQSNFKKGRSRKKVFKICNMVAVLDVISNLEKYPITKEALEETRLGKLINDVRKKTKDEDLAKRAKKLLRNWQKLIEPCQSDTPTSRGAQQGGPGSANGGSHPCRPDTPSSAPPPPAPPPGKMAPELKTRNDIHNTYSPVAEKSTSRKRKGDQRDSPHHLQSKTQKTLSFSHPYSSTPPSNGIGASPQPAVLERPDEALSDRSRLEQILENDRQSKIPVNAVKPHPSSPAPGAKLPSTSSLLKTSVLQQQQQQQARAEGDSLASQCSVNTVHDASTKRTLAYAPKGTLSSPAHVSAQVPSVLSVSSPALDGSSPPPPPLRLQQDSLSSHRSAEQAPQSLNTAQELSDFHGHNFTPASSTSAIKVEKDSSSANKKRKKYRSRDYTVNLHGQPAEDRTKPVRLKERRLTFDPVTGQIKPLTPKESHRGEEDCSTQQQQQQQPPSSSSSSTTTTAALPFLESARTDDARLGGQSSVAGAVSNPFQQTNWKELSRNEIIQSYLSLQSNMLTSSGAQTPGAHFFMTEYLKREERDVKEVRKTHVLVPTDSVNAAELPGESREVTERDLHRIHNEHWPGVNGCYDTKGNWYDWTECISLDSHGDESRLNILPYVFLD